MYHHFAHLKDFKVRKGQKVKRGQLIGHVGKTGTRYAHLHYEIQKTKPANWRQYVYGMTKEQIEARYENPKRYIDKAKEIPARYTTYGGYEWLNPLKPSGFHPGVDINDSWGDSDMGNDIKSPVDGTVVYKGKMEGGWGNHLFILEDTTEEKPSPWAAPAWDWFRNKGYANTTKPHEKVEAEWVATILHRYDKDK